MTARAAGPAALLGCALIGIALGEEAGPAPARGALASGVLAGVAAIVVTAQQRRALAFVLCAAALALLGSSAMSRALDGQVHSPVAAAVEGRVDATVDVTLLTDPDATRFSAGGLARLDQVRAADGTRRGGGRTVVIDATGAAADRYGVLAAGDRARLRGYFRPLDEFEARQRWRHAVGAFVADDLRRVRAPSSFLARAANAARAAVLTGHRSVPEPQRALLAGFLLGDTEDLPAPVIDEFRAAGLSHLLAVSGQNVAFVLALAGPVLRRGPRAYRFLATCAVLVLFAVMTRAEPSVLRACAMAACSSLALVVGRPTAGLRALVLAVLALVLIDPFLVHSVGFALSCAASAGIALFALPIAARVPGPRAIAEAFGVTVGAQLAVAPILVAVFDGVPLVAVPANLIAAPFAGPLTVLGLLGGVAGGLAGLGAGDAAGAMVGAVATFPAYVCASVILAVAHLAARAPVLIGGVELALIGVAAALTFGARRARRAT